MLQPAANRRELQVAAWPNAIVQRNSRNLRGHGARPGLEFHELLEFHEPFELEFDEPLELEFDEELEFEFDEELELEFEELFELEFDEELEFEFDELLELEFDELLPANCCSRSCSGWADVAAVVRRMLLIPPSSTLCGEMAACPVPTPPKVASARAIAVLID